MRRAGCSGGRGSRGVNRARHCEGGACPIGHATFDHSGSSPPCATTGTVSGNCCWTRLSVDGSLIPYGNEPEGMGGEPGRGRCWDRFEWDADVVLNGRWRQPRRRVVRCCPLRITGGWSCGACGREARECGQAVGNASALSTGCPHGPQGSRRSVGLVHKSTGFSPCRGVANRSTRRGAQCVHAALVSRRSMSRNSWSRAALTSRAAARSSSATATLSSCSKVTPGRR